MEENKDEKCAICFEDSSESPLTPLGCKHLFHSDCIEKWAEHNSCPVCRAPIDKSKPIKKYGYQDISGDAEFAQQLFRGMLGMGGLEDRDPLDPIMNLLNVARHIGQRHQQARARRERRAQDDSDIPLNNVIGPMGRLHPLLAMALGAGARELEDPDEQPEPPVQMGRLINDLLGAVGMDQPIAPILPLNEDIFLVSCVQCGAGLNMDDEAINCPHCGEWFYCSDECMEAHQHDCPNFMCADCDETPCVCDLPDLECADCGETPLNCSCPN